MTGFAAKLGERLYALLAEVYRTRDERGDLARLLDAFGALLDRVDQTIEQRLADSFPDPPPEGRPACQDWILPYFAQLLDVELVSPDVDGRREEVASAISWRQRKGTLAVIERVAEAVGRQATGRSEVELHEGFTRVACTPRIGWPLLPATTYGESTTPSDADPHAMATHPGLPAVTVDFGRPSRAVRAPAGTAGARTSTFDGRSVTWCHAHRHGVPCFPGTYEDVSRRTVDVRTPDWRRGHFHPKRVLLLEPPPVGFFAQQQTTVAWADIPNNSSGLVGVETVAGVRRYFNATLGTPDPRVIRITHGTEIELDDGLTHQFEDLILYAPAHLKSGRAVLRRVAADRLVVDTASDSPAVIDALDSLFRELEAPGGWLRLEYCTVMSRLVCRGVQASDCILPEDVGILGPASNAACGCVRYSRVPDTLAAVPEELLKLHAASLTTDRPIFMSFPTCDAGAPAATAFGKPGYGVLHPAAPASIRRGAEDGGEIGAYHHLRHCLRRDAVASKVARYLPLGIEVVQIPDGRLLTPPPDQSTEP